MQRLWPSDLTRRFLCCAVLFRASQVQAECITIPHAGHQLYLENPREFNATVVRIVKQAEIREGLENGRSSESNGSSDKKKQQPVAASSSGSSNGASDSMRHRAPKQTAAAQ